MSTKTNQHASVTSFSIDPAMPHEVCSAVHVCAAFRDVWLTALQACPHSTVLRM